MIQIVKYKENNIMYLGNMIAKSQDAKLTFSTIKPKNNSLSVSYYFSIE